MSNLAHVVQQLRKERDQAQRRVEQLDAALKALSGVGARYAELPKETAVLMRRAENEGPCPRRHAKELRQPSARGGQSGRQRSRRNRKTIMCGRYRLTAKERYLRDHFGLDEDPPWQPRWNIAPTQPIATIRQHPSEPIRIFGLMRWGLIPYWARDQSFGLKTINAMSETAAEKPAFRDAIKRHRCLIPADGFYEWKRIGPKEKQAYNFGLVTGPVFAFAGLWDRWRDPNNNVLETCTILTTRPNSLVADVHDRMPAILDPADYERWLDPGITNSETVLDGLKPFNASLMRKYPVSPRVNRPENDDKECAREVLAENSALTLF